MWQAMATRKAIMMSHPSRVRGLKFPYVPAVGLSGQVAPFTGAWIEMLGISSVV